MDEMLLMVAAAMLQAASDGLVCPEGATPSVTEDADGNLVVTCGENTATVTAEDAADLAMELADLMGAEEPSDAEEAPADAPAADETPAPEAQ